MRASAISRRRPHTLIFSTPGPSYAAPRDTIVTPHGSIVISGGCPA